MRIAVIVPCLNEEMTVAAVVVACRRALPEAPIYVLDNGSIDQTAERARRAGAHVIYSPLRGKGHVLRHAFRLIDADYYVMIDGDGTYPASETAKLIAIAHEYNFEMVMGTRLQMGQPEAFRRFHHFGNRLFTQLAGALFGYPVTDLLTGFRVFSRRFTEEVALLSDGFEVETELTVRAIAQDLAFFEVPIPYTERPQGSSSKLRTFRDGAKICWTLIRLFKDFRPLIFYCALAALTLTGALTGWLPPLAASTAATLSALFIALGFYFDSKQRWHKLQLDRAKNSGATAARRAS